LHIYTFIEIMIIHKRSNYLYECKTSGLHKMKIALITTCTNRKSKVPDADLCASSLPKGNLQSTISSWENHLGRDRNKIPAKDLYRGRGFSEVRKTIENNNLGLWIISAGLGLISGSQLVPSYNLTVAPSKKDTIQSRLLTKKQFQPARWWNNLNTKLHRTPTPIYDLISKSVDTYFIISLSRTYLELISEDLFLLHGHKQRIRLTGLYSSESLISPFEQLWMPYDSRFDGPQSPNPGTRSDFPQRVTRHFIEEVFTHNPLATPDEHAETVSKILATMSFPVKIKRTTLSNEAIKQIIIDRWDDAKGSGSRMLKIMRHEENVACEQSRFADLYRQIKLRMT